MLAYDFSVSSLIKPEPKIMEGEKLQEGLPNWINLNRDARPFAFNSKPGMIAIAKEYGLYPNRVKERHLFIAAYQWQ